MKIHTFLGACMIGATLLGSGVAGADSDSDRSHPRHFVKDSVITTKVKSKLAAEHLPSLARIHVDTDRDGVVWLSGSAHTQEAIDRAVDVARHTENVRDVHNAIHLKKDD